MSNNVSRQAVLDILSDVRDCISVDAYWAIIERLRKLPSTDRTGHWVLDVYDSRGGAWCDNCTTKFRNIPVIGGKVQLDFCPKCGADMRGERMNVEIK